MTKKDISNSVSECFGDIQNKKLFWHQRNLVSFSRYAKSSHCALYVSPIASATPSERVHLSLRVISNHHHLRLWKHLYLHYSLEVQFFWEQQFIQLWKLCLSTTCTQRLLTAFLWLFRGWFEWFHTTHLSQLPRGKSLSAGTWASVTLYSSTGIQVNKDSSIPQVILVKLMYPSP